jgi:hypothetical protein
MIVAGQNPHVDYTESHQQSKIKPAVGQTLTSTRLFEGHPLKTTCGVLSRTILILLSPNHNTTQL